MKRRIVVWITFVAGLYYVLEFLVPPYIGGAPDSSGASSASIRPSTNAADENPVLCYTGTARDRPSRLLSARLTTTPGIDPELRAEKGGTLLAPSPTRRSDYNGAENGQFAGPDSLYYIGIGWDDRIPRLCLARRAGGSWAPLPRAVLDRGGPGVWDSSGITWASVDPPGAFPGWRMWYVGQQGSTGRIGFATSADGIHWRKSAAPVYEPPAGGTVDTVSVLAAPGGPRAWIVEHDAAHPAGQIETVGVSPADGKPTGPPEAVAWQAPKDWRLGLPKAAIPLRGVRAVQLPDDPRAVRLLITYTGDDAKARVAVAENFPVAGERLPTVFSRQTAPLLQPGRPPQPTYLSSVRDRVDDLIVVIGAFAVGLGLVSLMQVHGKRVLRRGSGWPESVAFFLATTAMMGFTLYTRMRPGASAAAERGYELLFYGLFQPLGSSMFALLAAYLVSAAYRAFRIRTLESTLMAASAILIMLGQVPVGNYLTRSLPHALQIPTIMAWVLYVANNAVVRAINFGIFVGALATALRVWLSMDRAFMKTVE